MITKDDSRYTYEYENHYIIYPNFDWWFMDSHFKEGGIAIENGFEYNSGSNVEWLSIDDLKVEIEKLKI